MSIVHGLLSSQFTTQAPPSPNGGPSGGRPPSTAMQAPPTHRPIEQGVPSATRLAVSHIQLVGGTSQVQYPAVQHSGGHAVTPSAHRLVRRGGAPTVRSGSATSGGGWGTGAGTAPPQPTASKRLPSQKRKPICTLTSADARPRV